MSLIVLLKKVPKQSLSSPSITPIKTERPFSQGEVAGVSYIYDGDTIKLDTGLVVRYIGIDSPEMYSNKESKCYADEAYQRNKELVLNKKIILEKDISEKDRYGRLLRYIWIGDTLLNEELIEEGYAIAAYFPPDSKYYDRLKDAEEEAKSKKRGLWSKCGLLE
jgi:micrococcal nuclease